MLELALVLNVFFVSFLIPQIIIMFVWFGNMCYYRKAMSDVEMAAPNENNLNILPHKAKLYTSLTILFSTLCPIFIIGYYYIVFYVLNGDEHQQRRILYFVIFLTLSRLFMYLYFLERIKITFDDTKFELANKYYKIIKYSLLGLTGASSIIFQSATIITTELKSYNAYVAFSNLIIASFLDFFWGTLLTVLFLRRMCSIINVNKENKMNQHDSQYNYVVSKLAMLYCITFGTDIACIILVTLPQILFDLNLGLIVVLDTFINSLCLVLSFKFFDNSYKKLCCICRLCCEKT